MEDPNFELGKPNGDHQYNHSLKSPVFGRPYLIYNFGSLVYLSGMPEIVPFPRIRGDYSTSKSIFGISTAVGWSKLYVEEA
jgi:hypothetical protein